MGGEFGNEELGVRDKRDPLFLNLLKFPAKYSDKFP